MRELVYYVAVSLDGYIAAPDGRFDAFPVEGDHMGEVIGGYPDAIPTTAAERLGIPQPAGRFSTVLMGWNTYAVGLGDGLVSPYRHLEQIVFSRTRRGAAENLTITDADPVTLVRQLKQQPGAGIWLCGGGELAARLIDEIDRFVIKLNPLLFGDGIPLFGRTGHVPSAFDLVRSKAFTSSVIISEYVRSR